MVVRLLPLPFVEQTPDNFKTQNENTSYDAPFVIIFLLVSGLSAPWVDMFFARYKYLNYYTLIINPRIHYVFLLSDVEVPPPTISLSSRQRRSPQRG